MRKDALVCTACGVTRTSLVRARAARALSEAAESRRAVAHVPGVRMYCTGYGAVRGASVSSCVLLCCFVAGALQEVSRRKVKSLPNPKGVNPTQSPHHPLLTDLLGARAERVPDCSSYLSRIPWSAADSGSSVQSRTSCGSRRVGTCGPSTFAPVRGERPDVDPRSRKRASTPY